MISNVTRRHRLKKRTGRKSDYSSVRVWPATKLMMDVLAVKTRKPKTELWDKAIRLLKSHVQFHQSARAEIVDDLINSLADAQGVEPRPEA